MRGYPDFWLDVRQAPCKGGMNTPRALALLILALLTSLAEAAPDGERKPRRRMPEFEAPAGLVHEKDVVYGKVGDRELKLDVLRPLQTPDAPMPAVVWIHGGGFKSGRKEHDLPKLVPLAQAGFYCVTVSYRLIDEAPFPAAIQDCKCAVRYLRAKAADLHVDPDRIGAWGFSAGGNVVAMLGTSGDVKALEGDGGWADQSSRVQAVCTWAGIFDFLSLDKKALMGREDQLEGLFGGPIEEHRDLAAQASPLTHVSKDDAAFLVVRGERDPKIPLAQAPAFVDALRRAGVETVFHSLPNAGHGGPGFEKEIDEAVAFFNAKLKPAPETP